jgi:methylenetetrahydrofolate reductase (NADPH)
MRVSEMFASGEPLFSFEFFPPKNEEAAVELMKVVRRLRDLHPDFVSVTYGAGGSTRAKTLDLVARIKNEVGLEAVAHLTCVGHSRAEIRAILKELADRGIDNILALRGDPPKGETTFRPHPDGFQYANELTQEIALLDRFCIGVAGYPEKHIEAKSFDEDLRHLKLKVDAGASYIVTQLFFNNDVYFDFVARARSFGIRCPIIPGIMPVTNFTQIQRFAGLCGANLPDSLINELEPVQSDAEAVARIGINYAARQCEGLLRRGAPGIHFYTLNKSRATQEILEHLRGMRKPNTDILRDI